MAKAFTAYKNNKKIITYTLDMRKLDLSELLMKRAIYKTLLFDNRIRILRESIDAIEIGIYDKIEIGCFNKTLTNKKQYSYKDLVSLKNIKYNTKN